MKTPKTKDERPFLLAEAELSTLDVLVELRPLQWFLLDTWPQLKVKDETCLSLDLLARNDLLAWWRRVVISRMFFYEFFTEIHVGDCSLDHGIESLLWITWHIALGQRWDLSVSRPFRWREVIFWLGGGELWSYTCFLLKLLKVQLRKLSENERKDPWTSQFCRARETKAWRRKVVEFVFKTRSLVVPCEIIFIHLGQRLFVFQKSSLRNGWHGPN